MANKHIFASYSGKRLPQADTRNREHAPAYALSPRHKLAQMAATGTLSRTFYASGRQQLDEVLEVAAKVEPEFIAKTAVYARQRGYMKDMPALLVGVLSMRSVELMKRVFPRVIDNGRMLRTFVQMMRSGTLGRKSLGSAPKRQVQAWLNTASDGELIRAAVGQSPSLADVIRMVHPCPGDVAREALYAYLLGRAHKPERLPAQIQALERFKADASAPVPDVPFQMLTHLELTPQHWAQIADNAGWHMLRMNLNTLQRQCAFAMDGLAERVAARIRDEDAIRKARVFPYQVMAAHALARPNVPAVIISALEAAMEIAIANVPVIEGRVVVCPDVSGSMGSPVTGYREGATSAVRCIDVAALVTAAVVRRNPAARVLPFEQDVVDLTLDPAGTIVANAARLAAVGGGGTNCSAPLERLVAERAPVDLVLFVSDNQSWVDARRSADTGMMRSWSKLKAQNPKAKLVCIDIQPDGSTQAPDDTDILNVGGFSDAVFEIVTEFAAGRLEPQHWVGEIERIRL